MQRGMYRLSGMRIKMSIRSPGCRANEENSGTVWMLGERMDSLSIKGEPKQEKIWIRKILVFRI